MSKFRILLLLLVTLSCVRENIDPVSLERINLIEAYESKKEVLTSLVAKTIEYVPLESTPRCLLEEPYVIGSNDSLIIITSFRKLFIFNRQTGKFKYEISAFGRGPNEYLRVIPNGYDEWNNRIYVGEGSGFEKGLSLDGALKTRFKLPRENFEDGEVHFITSFWPYSGNTYIGYSKNASGNSYVKLERFDSSGKILYQYPNYNFFDAKKYNGSFIDGNQGWFFSFRDSVRFFEQYTDTIFTISEKKLVPRYYLNMGKCAPPYYYQGIVEVLRNEQLKCFYIKDIRESSRFLFFTAGINLYRHLCIYDKKLKITRICDIMEGRESYKYPSHYEERIIGLQNDLDDFVPIGVNRGGMFINKQDELATYIQASELTKWFKMNPEKVSKLRAKLKELTTVKETDNIIVIFLKLKN